MVSKMDDAQIICGVDKYPDYKKQPYKVYDDISKVVEPVDVVVDFSRPDATADLCTWSINKKCALLIATTGLGKEEYALLHAASKLIPVFHSANMSLGINLMIQLIKKSASFLGDAFDIEIVEKHHNQKVDAPSGTALALANEINSVLNPKKEFVYGRHTKTQKRTKSEIGIHSLRGGTIVGEHQVNFIGTDEYIEITHAAHSKQVFAQGAIRAALYITGKTNGFYSMEDMLLENSGITALKASEDIAMITCIAKNASMILNALSDINIDMISQSLPGENGTTLSCTLPQDDLPRALQSLKS